MRGLCATLRGAGVALLLAAVLMLPAGAVERIQVLGLFKDKAVVRIDGQRRLLRTNEVSPEGVRLISADSNAAVLEVEGEQRTFQLGSDVSTRLAPADSSVVRIYPNNFGMYATVGSINGQTVDFLLDTGASQIALNARHARLLGIDFRLEGREERVETASGVVRAYRVNLDTVQVGAIKLHNVGAVVLEGPSPRQALLGMSFLGRLAIENQGKAMVLRLAH